jgi:hypothetical protein
MVNELIVITSQTEESPQLLHKLRYMPILYSVDLGTVSGQVCHSSLTFFLDFFDLVLYLI